MTDPVAFKLAVRTYVCMYAHVVHTCPSAVQVTTFETPGVGPAEAKADTSGTDQKGPVSALPYPSRA